MVHALLLPTSSKLWIVFIQPPVGLVACLIITSKPFCSHNLHASRPLQFLSCRENIRMPLCKQRMRFRSGKFGYWPEDLCGPFVGTFKQLADGFLGVRAFLAVF